jgi:hypothetical protein
MSADTSPLRSDSEVDSPNAVVMAGQARTCGLVSVWARLGVFLSLPLLAVFLPVYLIDPYGRFSGTSIVADEVRTEYATRVNQALQAMITFSKNPQPNVILGDSQMALFRAEEIEALAGHPYSNLAYGGGTLAESIATFWYAARTVKLQRVYFGMSFYSFTDSSRNRISIAEGVIDHPITYFFNGDVLEATWDDAAAEFLHHRVSYRPTADAAAFWQQQLSELERRKRTFAPSQQTLEQLRAIVRFCRAQGIQFNFVIPPEHVDVRNRIALLGIAQKFADFKSRVSGLGPTYDCNVVNAVTRDAANFQDPFHMTRATATLMTQSIWSAKQHWCEYRQFTTTGGT